MGDQQQGHVEVFLEFLQKLEDLGLYRDVEGGGGFIRDQEFRVVREGHGDHDALTLAAR